MPIRKQAIKLTYPDGREVVYESIRKLLDDIGYNRCSIWVALQRGYLNSGKYKKTKIEKL